MLSQTFHLLCKDPYQCARLNSTRSDRATVQIVLRTEQFKHTLARNQKVTEKTKQTIHMDPKGEPKDSKGRTREPKLVTKWATRLQNGSKKRAPRHRTGTQMLTQNLK